jgi:hypothetical protein
MVGNSVDTPTILTEDSRGFPRVLQTNVSIRPILFPSTVSTIHSLQQLVSQCILLLLLLLVVVVVVVVVVVGVVIIVVVVVVFN